MSSPERDDIYLVLPTFNRADALRANLGALLALKDIAGIIVVNDGSTDDTLGACAEFEGKRLRVISHCANKGVARARNTGVQAAPGQWVLFGEDDCRFPVDYASVLRHEAHAHGADIVGAPILHTDSPENLVAEEAARAPRHARPSMEEVGAFPLRPIETPFLTALALVRRSVFDRVSFHETYEVNGYREETDFFVQAARAGFRCLLTPATYSYQLRTWDGGQHHASTLRYEYWALRNNWRFLRRHGNWLAEHDYIASRAGAQARFTLRRGGALIRGVSRSRIRRLRSRIHKLDPRTNG